MTTNNTNNANDENPLGVDNDGLTSDPILARHLDMAIEAQDGPINEESNNEGTTQNGTATTTQEAGNKESNSQLLADGSNSNSNNPNGNAQQQPKQEGTKEGKQSANPGDLVLPDGKIIKAGAERRLYETAQTARQERDHYKTQLDSANTRLQAVEQNYTQLSQQVQQTYNMEPERLVSAAKMYSDMRTDPVGTMTKLLAELGAAGYNIATLVPGVNAQLTERLGQINRGQLQQQNTPNEAVVDQQIEQEITSFYGRYPDARIHDDLIAQGLQQNPQASLVEVYFQLKQAFIDKGYDWNQPLAAQVSNQQQQRQQQQTPMPPNGRANNAVVVPTNKVSVASENVDTGDIVREAMREAGLNI